MEKATPAPLVSYQSPNNFEFFFPVGSNLDIPGGARTASSWKLSSLNLLSASLFYIRSLKDFLFSELNAVQLLNVCFFGAQKKKTKIPLDFVIFF